MSSLSPEAQDFLKKCHIGDMSQGELGALINLARTLYPIELPNFDRALHTFEYIRDRGIWPSTYYDAEVRAAIVALQIQVDKKEGD